VRLSREAGNQNSESLPERGHNEEVHASASFQMSLARILGYLSLANATAGVIVLSAAMALGAALRYRSRARMRELDQVKLIPDLRPRLTEAEKEYVTSAALAVLAVPLPAPQARLASA
jgi:hypothetical protein